MTTQRKTITASGDIKPRITLSAKDYEKSFDARAGSRDTNAGLGPGSY